MNITLANLSKFAAPPFLIWLSMSVLNAFFHFRTPEGWAEFCKTSPRLSLVVMLCGRFGIDPAGAIRDIRDWTKAYRQQGWQMGDAVDPPLPPVVLATSADVFAAVAARTITPEQGAAALEKLRPEAP